MINKYLLALLVLSLGLSVGFISARSNEDQNFKQFADRLGWLVDFEQAGRCDRLASDFGKEHDFVSLDPVIEKEIVETFKVCNITEPIIVLQNKNATNSTCYSLVDDEWYPVKVMVIGTGDGHAPLPLIRFSIFHECGHIVAGDVDQNISKDLPVLFSLVGASIYAGMRMSSALNKYSRLMRISGALGAAVGSLATLGRVYHKTMGAYYTRKIENNADIFAIRKLIGIGDYLTLTYQFLDFIYNFDDGKINMDNSYWLFHDHPGYLERARTILDELSNAFVELDRLPINEKDYPNKQALQDEFTAYVKNFFPEYLNH